MSRFPDSNDQDTKHCGMRHGAQLICSNDINVQQGEECMSHIAMKSVFLQTFVGSTAGPLYLIVGNSNVTW